MHAEGDERFGGRRIHPAAELFPLMETERLKDLADDIKEKGLLEPIVQTADGLFLDGRNRYLACELAGVAVRWETYTGADPWGYVISRNLQRRQLSDRQRAAIASKYANTREGRPKTTSADAVSDLPPTRQQAAELFNVSQSALERARRVQVHGTEELQAVVEEHNVPLNTAVRVALQPPEKQQEFVDKVRGGLSPKLAAPPLSEAPAKMPHTRPRIQADRYRYINREALGAIRDSLGALRYLFDSTEGLDPDIDAAEAERWLTDLGRERRNLIRLMNQLKERTA